MGAPLDVAQPFVPSFPPLAAFGGSPLYVTGEDALAVTVMNAAAGVVVTITGRMLIFGQTRPTPFTQTLTPATDRSESVVRFAIGDGWLLNVQVKVSSGTPGFGQTFARVSLVHGLASTAAELFTLAMGYITAKLPQAYPGSLIASSLDGGGALRSITGTTPAAGAEVSETVPTGARWEVLAFRTLLTTSATVINRLVELVLDDGALEYFRSGTSGQQAATIQGQHSFSQGWGIASFDGNANWAQTLPVGLRMGAGHRLRTTTNNLQVGDQYSLVQYLVREWIEGA